MTKNISIGAVVVAAALGALAFFGYTPFLKTVVQQFGTTSGTAGTQHIAEFSFNPTTASATTSSSQVNSDAQDRIIQNATVACSGVGTSRTYLTGTGLATLTFTMATTSTSAPSGGFNNVNTTYAGVIATSTATFFEASSTPGTITASVIAPSRRWASGSYLTIHSNATNTAACIVDVSYLQGLGV